MHNLFFLLFFSKITFYWKLFFDCCDQFGYPGYIVYLSCLDGNERTSFTRKYLDVLLCHNLPIGNLKISRCVNPMAKSGAQRIKGTEIDGVQTLMGIRDIGHIL